MADNLQPLGSLDEPVTEEHWPDYDPRSKMSKKELAKSKFFGASISGKTYPNKFTYRYLTGENFNQVGGTCYMATACNFAKTVVWLHTGLKLSISGGVCSTVADHIDGGYHRNCSKLLTYSGDNECIKKFQEICSSCGVTKSNLKDGADLPSTGENAVIALNEYGPFYWGHHCCFYSSHKYGQDNHAILVIGYDMSDSSNKKIFWKGSWTSSESDNQSGFGSCSWSDFQTYGYGIYSYNKKLWKNL